MSEMAGDLCDLDIGMGSAGDCAVDLVDAETGALVLDKLNSAAPVTA